MLHIHRLHARYHLPGGDDGLHSRLDRVRDMMLLEGLEAALDRLGVHPEEHVCLRRVLAPVRFLMTSSDASMEMDWSLAMAQSIRTALEQGNNREMVRYPTRLRALIDFALGVAHGDYRRIWAWRQMGLWQGRNGACTAEAVGQLTAALQCEGAAVAPVLCALAGAGALEALDARLGTESWILLAKAALAASGGDQRLLEIEVGPLPAVPWLTARAERAARYSILQPLAQAGSSADPRRQQAVAALILLSYEPAALQAAAPVPTQLLAATIRSLWITVGQDGSRLIRTEKTSRRKDARPGTALPDGAEVKGERENTWRGRAATDDVQVTSLKENVSWDQASPGGRDPLLDRLALDFQSEASRHDEESHRWSEGADSDNQDRQAGLVRKNNLPVPSDFTEASATGFDTASVGLRSRGSTLWGGLLFLLWIIDECEIPRLTAERLPDRSLRSVLHRLALLLLPLGVHDPVALAFAGLAPNASLPTDSEPPVTPEENAEIEGFADSIRETLTRRLLAVGDALSVRQVCARRAEIVADPGWIEIHMPLGEVSTQLRHCGLDLNPGYIPWLGVVMRFVYE